MDGFDLVNKARDGDREALIQLVMEAKDDYYRLAYVYLRNKEDALDAVQDMIVALYKNIGQLKKPESFYSWSKTILVNCCRKNLRKRNRHTILHDRDEPHSSSDITVTEQRQDILQGLNQLNPHQQEAIQLRYFLGWDYDSIAEATGVPLGTVKSRISLGLAKLKGLLGGEYRDR